MATQLVGPWEALLRSLEPDRSIKQDACGAASGWGGNAGGPSKETLKAASQEVGSQEDSDQNAH